jgi:hypothetical protein
MARLALVISVIAFALVLALTADAATALDSSGAPIYPNCRALNAHYPHGVGKVGAHDRTSGTPPVRTFKRSNALYYANRGRDRNKDGIACEKA